MTRCWLGCAMLALAGCGDGGVAVSSAWLDVPARVSADDAAFGTAAFLPVVLENTGTDAASVVLSTESPFAVADERIQIASEDQAQIAVSITPDQYEPITGVLQVRVPGVASWTVELDVTVDPDADGDGEDAVGAGGSDCDDFDASVNTAAVEVCDGRDTDCSGTVDDPDEPPVWYLDADGDTWGVNDTLASCNSSGDYTASRAGDCDDTDADVFPEAPEVWYDGVDQDCAGDDDYDQDGDGFDLDSTGGSDCDDTDPSIRPDADEIWYDGVDQDCAGDDDYDQDDDGERHPSGGGADCDDTEPSVYPGGDELDDGLDNDCDAHVDEIFFEYGDLVFSEFHLDPSVGESGVWVEVWNPSVRDIPASSVSFESDGESATLDPGWIDGGTRWVLCVNESPGQNGQVSCDGLLPVSAGTEWILSREGVVLDAVDQLDWPAPTLGASWQSVTGDPAENNLFESWCVSESAWAGGDRGTPGDEDDCP